MKWQQVFASYNYHGNTGIEKLRYCPACGTECVLQPESDRLRPVCPKCGLVQYRNPSPAVSVLIIDGGKILLGKRADWNFEGEKWCLPCGFIEFDEDFLTAGCREVREETGLEVAITGIINVAHNFFNEGLHTLVVVLAAQVRGGVLQPNDDLTELRWFGPDEQLPDLAFEADRILIDYYRQGKLTRFIDVYLE